MSIRFETWIVLLLPLAATASSAWPASVPPDQRGRIDAERSGFHDAANIRTVFWNYGMVGDYPPNPGGVDLSVFHSAEVPKGSGMNYSDGVTPFVLAKVRQRHGDDAYIMETGFRERQGLSPIHNRIMRFEPRPGYFQPDPSINRGRSPAISNDPRTWPEAWPDRAGDPDDPGWRGSWNGYFGKRPAADQESYTVMDDDFYDAWNFFPDTTDLTRRGLGLRVEVRGFQWANPQAGNVIFWHYDITNESTTDYADNIIFGLYMDSGVGGSAISCDGIFESDDDNAFFDKSLGLNLVYTWDKFGHGRDLSGPCGRTGYLGYAYLETPGNSSDGLDNDNDGILNERRDGGPGQEIVGQQAILAFIAAQYDTAKFFAFYGPLDKRPAYRAGRWWTGDEDMDWRAEQSDLGADGVAETGDTGEGDGSPTEGEPNFDGTDLNESDQIGLTGFKMNRIRAGQGNDDQTVDGVLFYTDNENWPQRLYEKFTAPFVPARFDSALAANYNIGFLFASGPFRLEAGKTERFSLALAYGADLFELRETVQTVQQIYNANYQFAVPPPMPTLTAEAGDHFVRLSWDDVAERGVDPVSNEFDFEGYRVYRATDPDFRDARVLTSGRGNPLVGNGQPIAQFDLQDGKRGYSDRTIDGVAYYLGDETGITHTWTDTTAVNGQAYYYAVTAYDFGSPEGTPDSLSFYPSENAITVSRTPRGGLILPKNVVTVRPNPKVAGFVPGSVEPATHVAGEGTGTVDIRVVNANLLPDGHTFKLTFTTPSPDSIRARAYTLTDSTTGEVLFTTGHDFNGQGIGAVGSGLLPLVTTPTAVSVDAARSGYVAGSPTNTRIRVTYQPGQPINLRRPGYPDDITIVFDDVVRDTGLAITPFQARPAKFRAFAHSAGGDRQLDFIFNDVDLDGTLSRANEYVDVLTYDAPPPTAFDLTWHFVLDTLGQGARGPIVPARLGDVYDLKLTRPFSDTDVFVFTTRSSSLDPDRARAAFDEKPYVVPNPYVGAASFEPERFAISGRGERRIEFRAVPSLSIIRIYTVRGDLVQTLRHDGSTDGYVAWNLRTKDNLDLAPGLYVFHLDAPGIGTHVGKFAIIK
ncbi:MAG TPA: hypothetical protein VEY91_03145 [Candidatus Limnocylindria bacterium]|nr:hypothetical protein [Candidatus Limnocylindria bacterium]